MERNITQCLNKLPAAAASRQHGCEVHSDFTGAVYLDMELFICSAARNSAQRPGCPGAGTVFVTVWGRDRSSGHAEELCSQQPMPGAGGAEGAAAAKGPVSPGCSVTALG